MSTLSARRKPVKPARGRVRWLHRLRAGIGAIAIADVPYAVAELREQGRLVGYRLARHDARGAVVMHDIDTHWQCWECSCPDFLYRRLDRDPAGCKHIKAVRAAVAAGRGIRLYQPKEGEPFVP